MAYGMGEAYHDQPEDFQRPELNIITSKYCNI